MMVSTVSTAVRKTDGVYGTWSHFISICTGMHRGVIVIRCSKENGKILGHVMWGDSLMVISPVEMLRAVEKLYREVCSAYKWEVYME